MKDEVRVKAGRKAKRKGRAGEYSVRDIFQAAFPSVKVERTPMSGAWHGLTVLSGDLIFISDDKPDLSFPFFWEVKNYAEGKISYPLLLLGGSGPLAGWYKEASDKCKTLIPVVVWRTNRVPWFVYISMKTYRQMSQSRRPPLNTMSVLFMFQSHVVMPLDDFIRWLQDIKKREVKIGPRTQQGWDTQR